MFNYLSTIQPSDSDYDIPKLYQRKTSDNWFEEEDQKESWHEEFPNFLFLNQLSATDCSTIWLVKDLINQRQCVAKIVPKNNNSQSGKIQQERIMEFLQNIKLYKSVKILQIQNTTDFYLMTMEHFSQGDLASYTNYFTQNLTLKYSKQHIKWIQFCFNQIVEAVSELHDEGYIHRDIKPSNFLVDSTGQLKLNDFGLVAKKDSIHATFCGTLSYMAPENLNCKKSKLPVKASTDMWSLGITLYELLTGKVPFDGYDKEQMIQLIYGGYIQFQQDVPLFFKQLIVGLLQINIDQRMNMPELQKYLQKFNQ